MAIFPALSTGSVTQYPLEIKTGQESQLIRFLDGSDQRYSVRARTLRQWRIPLTLLNENETQALEMFFADQLGSYSVFSFPDPYSGTLVPNCRFGEDAFQSDYVGVDDGSGTVWIVETNG